MLNTPNKLLVSSDRTIWLFLLFMGSLPTCLDDLALVGRYKPHVSSRCLSPPINWSHPLHNVIYWVNSHVLHPKPLDVFRRIGFWHSFQCFTLKKNMIYLSPQNFLDFVHLFYSICIQLLSLWANPKLWTQFPSGGPEPTKVQGSWHPAGRSRWLFQFLAEKIGGYYGNGILKILEMYVPISAGSRKVRLRRNYLIQGIRMINM